MISIASTVIHPGRSHQPPTVLRLATDRRVRTTSARREFGGELLKLEKDDASSAEREGKQFEKQRGGGVVIRVRVPGVVNMTAM